MRLGLYSSLIWHSISNVNCANYELYLYSYDGFVCNSEQVYQVVTGNFAIDFISMFRDSPAPITLEYNMMFVDKKTLVTLGFFEEAVGKQT